MKFGLVTTSRVSVLLLFPFTKGHGLFGIRMPNVGFAENFYLINWAQKLILYAILCVEFDFGVNLGVRSLPGVKKRSVNGVGKAPFS